LQAVSRRPWGQPHFANQDDLRRFRSLPKRVELLTVGKQRPIVHRPDHEVALCVEDLGEQVKLVAFSVHDVDQLNVISYAGVRLCHEPFPPQTGSIGAYPVPMTSSNLAR
jgi:hypothetical protein